jgi:uncharacterized membrane protein
MNSIIIARLLGPLLLAGAAAVLVNRKELRRIFEGGQNTGLVYLGGVISLLMGLAIVQFHNVLATGWQSIITVLGHLMLVRGLMHMLFPARVAQMQEQILRSDRAVLASGVISAVLGLILTFRGFTAAM